MLKVSDRRKRALIAALQQHVDNARTVDVPQGTSVPLAAQILNVSGEMQKILREELDELNEAIPFKLVKSPTRKKKPQLHAQSDSRYIS